MKKILVIILVILPLALYAQVRVAEPAQRVAKPVAPYDSTYIVCEKNLDEIKRYIGQEFFVIPKSEQLQNYGYEMTREKTGYISGRIPYDELAGKTLRVVDVVYGGRTSYDRDYYLTLVNESENDTVYWKFSDSEYDFPFLVLGFKDKYEKTHKGKTFLFKGVERDDISDFNTGKAVHLKPGDKWTFEELIIVPSSGAVAYVRYMCSNAKGEHVAFYSDWFVEKTKMDKLARKYGQRLCNTALNDEIAIGMPKELVELAWGKPKSINSASYGEQWVYSKDYVYFKNGKVTGWN